MSLNRDELLSGTRPAFDRGQIIMTAGEGFDGYEIMEYLGMVWGISVRAKDFGQDFAMGCKQISGGELTSYTQLGDESRQKSVDRMMHSAGRMEANGIINVKFELESLPGGVSQVVVNGTAVFIKPIEGYVPTGAVGNILFEMQENLRP